jgi:hypothetical protein
MKKQIIILITGLLFTISAYAKDKLYVINSASTGGSFNAIMSATAEDLKKYYDIEYVQAGGCAKAGVISSKLANNGEKIFFIWSSLKISEAYNGSIKNKECKLLPNINNFVRADIKYGMMFTKKNGIDKEMLMQKGKVLKIAFNHTANEVWLKAFLKHHNLPHKTIRYENSKAIVLGIMSGEVDIALINSASSFWKKSKDLKALWTLNPKGEHGIVALSLISDFDKAADGQADSFLVNGFNKQELIKFKKIIREIHNDPASNVAKWYSTVKGYSSTLDTDDEVAVDQVISLIQNWINVKIK